MAAETSSTRHTPIRVDVKRGDVIESWHEIHGHLHAPDASSQITWGESGLVTTLRSSLKPFQSLVLLLDDVVEHYGFTDEEIAITVGSHSGQPAHIDIVGRLMGKIGIDDDDLRCCRHRPFNKDAARAVGPRYTVRHNNCSGKHAGMLAWCRLHEADAATYTRPDHPLQIRILEIVAMLAGIRTDEVGVAVDGCTVPSFAMPLAAMARAFSYLGAPDTFDIPRDAEEMTDPMPAASEVQDALYRVRTIMATHPFEIAGTGRPDTDVIRSTGGRIVTKAGAEGLWCGFDAQDGAGFAFKAVDGNFRAVVPAALSALTKAGRLTEAELLALDTHHRSPVRSLDRKPIGVIETVTDH